MRVKQAWTNEDEVHIDRLVFPWPYLGQSFSFDLGGILSGGAFEGHFFLGESKNTRHRRTRELTGTTFWPSAT